MKSQTIQNSELDNNPTPATPVQAKTENTHTAAQSKLPPVQTKQGKQAPIQSKEGQKPPIQAKQRPVQRNQGSGSSGGGNVNEAQVKANVSALTGTDVTSANVVYNSSQPAQLQAEATAQGNDVHLAPGKEKHLGHELTHVAQQKQGRVKPTVQANNGKVNINDDPRLEKEADDIGAQAMQMKTENPVQAKSSSSTTSSTNQNQPVQLFPQKGKVTVPKAKVQEGKNRVKVHKSNIKDVDGRGFRLMGNRDTQVTVSSKTKAELTSNTIVSIDYDMLDSTGNYVWVQYPQGNGTKIGYIRTNYVQVTDPELYYHKPAVDKDDDQKHLIAKYENVDQQSKLFPETPNASHVKQGQLGDCYFVTAVSSLVMRDPSKITEMMTDKGDYVEVKFYNDKKKRSTVRVNKSVVKYSNGEHALVGKDAYTRGSIWVQLLEKAYATFLNTSYTKIQDGVVGDVWKHLLGVDSTHEFNDVKNVFHTHLSPMFRFHNNTEQIKEIFGSHFDAWKSFANFSIQMEMDKCRDYTDFVKFFGAKNLDKKVASKALSYLSKHYTYIGEGKYTEDQEEAFNKISVALKKGEMVAAGTPSVWYQYGGKVEDENEGMVGHHYYSVFGAETEKSSGRKLLHLRNPWGLGGVQYDQENLDGVDKTSYKTNPKKDMNPQNNGIFKIDIAHFLRTVDVIMYSSGMDKL
jgi:hypothetical protein